MTRTVGHAHAPGWTWGTTDTKPLPSSLADHSIPLRRRDRDIEHVHARRLVGFQYLVRRYIIQIRYGCRDRHCTTPTCFSCQRRVSRGPVRRPTPITARTLAFFLAGQDDPAAGLCPNKPAVPPGALAFSEVEIEHMLLRTPRAVKETVSGAPAVSDTPPQTNGQDGHSGDASTPDRTAPSRSEADEQAARDKMRWLRSNTQKKKDRKSLAQSLFDTLTTKVFEWWDLEPTVRNIFQPPAHSRSTEPPAPQDVAQPKTLPNGQLKALPNGHAPGSTPELAPIPTTRTPAGHNAQPSISLSTYDSPQPEKNPRKETNGFLSTHTSSLDENSIPSSLPRDSITSTPNRRIRRKQSFSHSTQTPEKLRKTVETDNIKETSHTSTIPREKSKRFLYNANPFLRTLTARRHPSPTRDCHLSPERTAAPDPAHLPSVLSNGAEHLETSSTVKPVCSHLTVDLLKKLFSLAEGTLNEYADAHGHPEPSGLYSVPARAGVNGWLRDYTYRSLFHSLSSVEVLLESFRSWPVTDPSRPLSYLDHVGLWEAFGKPWKAKTGSLIYDSLWMALEPLFEPPPSLAAAARPARQSSRPHGTRQRRRRFSYVSDVDAAHIVMICIYALTSGESEVPVVLLGAVRADRANGIVFSNGSTWFRPPKDDDPSRYLAEIDDWEYEPALRLAHRLVRALAARKCFAEAERAVATGDAEPEGDRERDGARSFAELVVEQLVVARDALEAAFPLRYKANYRVCNDVVLLEILTTLIQKNWDGKPRIRRWGVVGGAIEFMSVMYKHRQTLGIPPESFDLRSLAHRLDLPEAGFDFLRFQRGEGHDSGSNKNVLHILQHPYLFLPWHTVACFRTVNFTTMAKAYEFASYTGYLVDRISAASLSDHASLEGYLRQRLQPTLSRYLVLDVRRDTLLEDAFDALWGRERRELLRPLKVRLGRGQGEEGVDHGGVTQEFLRLAIIRACAPEFGLFTPAEGDPTRPMLALQPASPAPYHQFELVGLLVGLAIYNGVTLPVTFPLAFYRAILARARTVSSKHGARTGGGGEETTTTPADIADGWPVLARGLHELLNWTDGDVGDVFVRTYEFSFEAVGEVVHVDMDAFGRDGSWPVATSVDDPEAFGRSNETEEWQTAAGQANLPPLRSPDWRRPRNPAGDDPTGDEEAPLVTNANRARYVADYIYWLTDKSVRPQLQHFARGMWACLDPGAIRILTPPTLRALVEGTPTVSLEGLRAAARYEDGYTAAHPTVAAFWAVVAAWPPPRLRQLLEFVTASDRVPVAGERALVFCVVRAGGDSDLLPTAMTCFGKLLLPEYSDQEKLREKLELAVENCRGFGTA